MKLQKIQDIFMPPAFRYITVPAGSLVPVASAPVRGRSCAARLVERFTGVKGAYKS